MEEYVVRMCDELFGDLAASYRFALRLEKGYVSTDRKGKYLASEEVIDTVKAFGMDVDKFWYLCLFIKDIVYGYTVNAVLSPQNPREKLSKLVSELEKVDDSSELILKVSKHKVRITDSTTLSLIKDAVTNVLADNNELLDSVPIDFSQKKDLKPVYQIYLFNKYLSWFIKPLMADKASLASKDKNLLISRMIFILGISDDENYFEEYNDKGDKLNFLKNNLRRYQDVKIPTMNKYYWDCVLIFDVF